VPVPVADHVSVGLPGPSRAERARNDHGTASLLSFRHHCATISAGCPATDATAVPQTAERSRLSHSEGTAIIHPKRVRASSPTVMTLHPGIRVAWYAPRAGLSAWTFSHRDQTLDALSCPPCPQLRKCRTWLYAFHHAAWHASCAAPLASDSLGRPRQPVAMD
jgi:hypothetical protein